jgi:hypothetical protein
VATDKPRDLLSQLSTSELSNYTPLFPEEVFESPTQITHSPSIISETIHLSDPTTSSTSSENTEHSEKYDPKYIDIFYEKLRQPGAAKIVKILTKYQNFYFYYAEYSDLLQLLIRNLPKDLISK